MKISIVTISFNQVKYLAECLDSVLNQERVELEYIVLDPGSTDGSRNIISARSKEISKIVFEPDQGPADALNRGMKLATGEILGYLNSDDTLLPDTLARVIDIFNKHPAVDIVYGNGFVTDTASRIIRRCFSDNFELRSYAYGGCITIQPSTFFRRDIFEKVKGFNIENRSNWDGELLVDMHLAGAKSLKVNDFFSCYRVHNQGITGSGRLATMHSEYNLRMFEKIVGRSRRFYDSILATYYRARKHVKSPAAFVERIVKGPIFAASIKENK